MKNNYYQHLQYYRKCIRKFNRLKATSSDPKKQRFLWKRIEKSLETLQAFHTSFKLKMATAAVAGIMVVSDHSAFGQASFGPPQLSPFGMGIPDIYYGHPRLVDLDGDGDLDILNTNVSRNFVFQENIGTATAPAFAAEVSNPFGLTGQNTAFSFYPADLDNDGDLDLIMGLGGSGGNNHLYYIENTGSASAPAFAPQVMDPFGLGSSPGRVNPVMLDIDNDGDLDMMASNINLGWSYFENTGSASSPAFGSLQSNPFGLAPLPAPMGSYDSVADCADLDGDGDLDLLAGEFFGDFFYFENTGTNTAPAFAAPTSNPFGLVNVNYTSTVSFGDLDGDGDLDLLSRSEYDTGSPDGFRYFENTDISTSIANGLDESEFSVYPNPSEGLVHIRVDEAGTFALLNVMGQELRVVEVFPGANSFDINGLPEGVYFLRDTNKGQSIKLVKQ